ncbi:MAG: very short patch repair endonuclease [Actinobacteria bacterium]|nr:very short patch repair endonuclease [Actinomycetota bacterium]MCL6093230.1 very short patch repair endonuclease [Actinomycetota bacterium]
MTDIVPPEVRSRMMAGIRGKNTKPELAIRKGLFAKGFRYRLHDSRLPGKPDLVLPRYHAVIFVNGCFWHGHNCPLFKWPASNTEFWRDKITRNRENDKKCRTEVAKLGWRVLTIWECSFRGPKKRPIETVVEETAMWLRSDSVKMEIKWESK